MADNSGRITLWGIEIFVATAEEASITAAARRLGASNSTVSQQLTNLEGALGTALLNRNERPMSLTPAGRLFKQRAQTVLNVAARARAELARQDPSTLRQLRLGMIEDFDSDVTPALLREIAGDLIRCQFELETGASHRLLDRLEARALDVVVAAEIGVEENWMEAYPVLTEPFIAAVPKGLIEKGADTRAKLPRAPLILYTARHHMGQIIRGHLTRQNLNLNHRFELDSYHAIMAMVAAGAGWTILTPLGVLHAHRFRDQVDLHPLPFAPLSRTISLVARRDVHEGFPAEMAARLRPLIQELVVSPAVSEFPWLRGTLRVEDSSKERT